MLPLVASLQAATDFEVHKILSSQAKGHDTSRHALACFGGAGGQHACAIARALGMKTIYIHK